MGSCGLFIVILLIVCSLCVVLMSPHPKHGKGPSYFRKVCDDGDEVVDTSTCKFGIWTTTCGRSTCLKGAGEVCDETTPYRFGKCTDNLVCSCGKCQGWWDGEYFTSVSCFGSKIYSKKLSNYPIEYKNSYNEY